MTKIVIVITQKPRFWVYFEHLMKNAPIFFPLKLGFKLKFLTPLSGVVYLVTEPCKILLHSGCF